MVSLETYDQVNMKFCGFLIFFYWASSLNRFICPFDIENVVDIVCNAVYHLLEEVIRRFHKPTNKSLQSTSPFIVQHT